MGRIKKGEKFPGEMRPCAFCKKMLYRSPSRLIQKKTYCREHKYADAFNFPCKICKTPIYTQPTQLKYRCRSTCSLTCRKTLARRRANKRRKSYTKHQIDRLIRYSPEIEVWRKLVFERDNWTCQECKVRGNYLEAHHIKPFAYFPDLRFELSNGMTLCRPCHDKTKKSAKELQQIYANKN